MEGIGPRPSHFPELPPCPTDQPWPTNVRKAYYVLSQKYNEASTVLQQEDADPLRLRLYSQKIRDGLSVILAALQTYVGNEDWVSYCLDSLARLAIDLESAASSAENVSSANVRKHIPVKVIRTGKRGRPPKVIDADWLRDATSARRNISMTALGDGLSVHRHTIRKNMRAHGITRSFSEISDDQLTTAVRLLKLEEPNSGLGYALGRFRSHGVRIQKERVRHAINIVDPLGRALRNFSLIDQKIYRVARPNALWHLDGHHKAMPWGIVVHGVIDGYTRRVVSLRAATNNRSSTVLEFFVEAVNREGAPSRTRADRGGENIQVAVWMVRHRGANRGSHLWGSSTRNSRIERLWVEVGSRFVRAWRAFFQRLERLHRLNRKNPYHLWLLHSLFLDEINKDCQTFIGEWNHHPVSGSGHNRSPEASPSLHYLVTNDPIEQDMLLMGELKHGTYTSDDLSDIHPNVLEQYYGVYGRPRGDSYGHGAGSSGPDLNDDETEDPGSDGNNAFQFNDVEERITEDQSPNVRHEGSEPANHQSPFPSLQDEARFRNVLNELDRMKIIPNNFCLRDEDFEDFGYPSHEELKMRGGKTLELELPQLIWWPRAVRWARALEMLVRLQTDQVN